ncbi:MAG: hypothetical protein HY898_00590 [Deltaproteobacteria bacterium]|nr:hypothetical protein [Deltaproteobacteria bacterium]
MRRSNHSFLLLIGLLSAAIVGSCGGKVEVNEGGAGTAGKGGTVVGTGGAGGSSKGGSGGTAKGGTGGWAGGDGTGGKGWGGGDGAGGWGGGTGGSSWGGGDGSGWGGADGSGWGGSGGSVDGGSTYGLMTEIKFSTPFLLDSEKLDDNSYIQQHGNAILYNAAFFGYYGLTSKPIPPLGGQDLAYGVHVPGQGGYPPTVQITQYSVKTNNDYLNPLVMLYFASDKINTGTMEVGLSATAGAYLLLYNSLNQGQDYCAIAVGYGTLQITQAEKTTAPDGGVLSLYGANLPLYYPTQTPDGDVSQMVGTVCPKE